MDGYVFKEKLTHMFINCGERFFAGLGFSYTGGMEDADIVIVWVDGTGNGQISVLLLPKHQTLVFRVASGLKTAMVIRQ
jgi:hypothetical protein